jgi:DNA-binding transcriptional MerR regulator
MTIDELALRTGTTSRTIRSLQTRGLLEHPDLRGRQGLYGERHLERLRSVLLLQDQGFSLQSLALLYEAQRRGVSLGALLGVAEEAEVGVGEDGPSDDAELYGFADLQRGPERRRGTGGRPRRPLLSVVPTTVWSQTEAS